MRSPPGRCLGPPHLPHHALLSLPGSQGGSGEEIQKHDQLKTLAYSAKMSI